MHEAWPELTISDSPLEEMREHCGLVFASEHSPMLNAKYSVQKLEDGSTANYFRTMIENHWAMLVTSCHIRGGSENGLLYMLDTTQCQLANSTVIY